MAGATTSMSIRMDRTVKFEVTTEGATSTLIQRLAEADNDPDIHGPFHSVEALMEDLNEH